MRKRLQKIDYDVILHYISLPIFTFFFIFTIFIFTFSHFHNFHFHNFHFHIFIFTIFTSYFHFHFLFSLFSLPNFALHFTSISFHFTSFHNSRRLSNFLQTNIFWNFDNVSRTYYQINYRNIWLPKAIIILIIIAQVLFFNVFFEKTRTLMPLSNYSVRHYW